jgi:hypothetical protein
MGRADATCSVLTTGNIESYIIEGTDTILHFFKSLLEVFDQQKKDVWRKWTFY